MKIIDEFESYCRDYVLPLLVDDILKGRWKGVVLSSINEHKLDDKLDTLYILQLECVVDRELSLLLSLWGVLEDNVLNICCKCHFLNQSQNEESLLHINQRIEEITETCKLEFLKKGFGVKELDQYLCVWASLGEPDGRYVVNGIDEPYDLFSTFIDEMINSTL